MHPLDFWDGFCNLNRVDRCDIHGEWFDQWQGSQIGQMHSKCMQHPCFKFSNKRTCNVIEIDEIDEVNGDDGFLNCHHQILHKILGWKVTVREAICGWDPREPGPKSDLGRTQTQAELSENRSD